MIFDPSKAGKVRHLNYVTSLRPVCHFQRFETKCRDYVECYLAKPGEPSDKGQDWVKWAKNH